MYSKMLVLLMANPEGKSNPASFVIFMGAILVVMYFFMIRPQSKKAKVQKQFNEGIQKGDKIVTIAGIHGRITKMNDDTTLQIEVGPGTFMTIERSAISMDFTIAHNKRTEVKK